ncbi:hypothetical protein FXB39_14310 [Nocardioides sp. BGMRC 2183]|nr:hypothetical protein FXB39_14310 [Nocardioides sp. BGMRC 2183]
MTDQYDEAAAAEPSRDEPGQDEPDNGERRESDWQRKRRLAEIFGDALPATTSDERDPSPRNRRGESAGDRWLKSQVPPHHGG